MNYYYHQSGQQDNEKWRAVPENKLGDIKGAMFVTVLGIDSPVTDSATKEQLADIKYIGPMYWDFDSENAWDTAKSVNDLVTHLIDEMEVREQDIALYASGGKGFHVLVPQAVFMIKPVPMVNLPLIYKEMAYEVAREHMDFRVYTARRGRMFRQANVLRPNGLYKVRILRTELQALASLPPEEAKAEYARLCSAPRMDPPIVDPETATEMLALFDACKSKVTKVRAKAKKRKPVKLPANLPSFDALLRGEGIDSESGFHQIALQVAITAHQRGLSQEDLLSAATGLCENHSSDSSRYNTPGKRRAELARMWDYTEDNPCYEYSGAAVASLLTHNAPDLRGLEVDADELDIVVPEEGEGNEFDHAGVILTRRGMFMQTEEGPKQLSAMAFENVTELVSVDTNRVSVLQADVVVSGVRKGAAVLDLESFNSVAKFNSLTMPHGQSFSGTDVQARGVYMRLVEKARKNQKRMYCVGREGLDVISMPFHEDEELRKPFMVWSDVESVTPEPRIADKNLIFKFVGFPSERGQFECDLSKAPQLAQYLRDGSENVERFTSTLKSLLSCQKPGYIGKLVGWMVACHYRMLFHKVYDKFPLLHINGAAGSGKCLAKGTPVLMADGTTRKVEDVKVGESLMGPDGKSRKVLSTTKGRERMYKVSQSQGDAYCVNASHILSLKNFQGKIVNVNVEDYYDSSEEWKDMHYGWRVPGVLTGDLTSERTIIDAQKLEVGDYYGFQISGDHLFMLGDFTVTHNTETTKLISHLHYYNTEPKMVTPSSTFFPIQYAAAGSCSIPLIIDEFKPQDMQGQMHDKFRLLFRDAYNCREMARGGGTRENSDYRAIHAINLSAPICFIAEAAESESAVMERVVLLTMVKPAAIEATKYLRHFEYVKTNKDILSMIGHYMSASLVRRYSVDMLKEDFDPVYEEARLQLMLQPGEEATLSREEVERKSNAKERTVFNYAVARFGLLKLKNFVMKAAPDTELDALFTEALSDSYDSGSTQSHTQPEWLKVMNEFVHMSRLAPDSQAYLQEGTDFAYVEEGGVDCIEIYTASCYYKYRVYVRGMGSKPLFPSSAAFTHAVDNLPSVKAKNQSHVIQPSTGVHILSLSELRAAGFIPPLSK